MDNSADDAPRLVAAPRHLRRRILHEEIPDELLVPGVEPFPAAPQRTSGTAQAKRAADLDPHDDEIAYRRKRLAALVAVVVVCVSVPALIAALLLLG